MLRKHEECGCVTHPFRSGGSDPSRPPAVSSSRFANRPSPRTARDGNKRAPLCRYTREGANERASEWRAIPLTRIRQTDTLRYCIQDGATGPWQVGSSILDRACGRRASHRRISRGISSVGRAFGWQPKGQRFEPAILQLLKSLALRGFFLAPAIPHRRSLAFRFRYAKMEGFTSTVPLLLPNCSEEFKQGSSVRAADVPV